MKKIWLEFPLLWGENSKKYLPGHVWLKVVGNSTKAFKDKNLTECLPKKTKNISLEIEVPEELEIIEVIPPGGTTPIQDVLISWAMLMPTPNCRVPGLENISIIFDDMIHEVTVLDEKPNSLEFRNYLENDKKGTWLFHKNWVLVVYYMKDKVISTFHWHSILAGF